MIPVHSNRVETPAIGLVSESPFRLTPQVLVAPHNCENLELADVDDRALLAETPELPKCVVRCSTAKFGFEKERERKVQ